MKKIGVALTARPGGGSFQYSQSILDAVLRFPRDAYSIVAPYKDPRWLTYVGAGTRTIELHDSLWNRGLNRAWHELHLPISAWRRTAARLDTNMRALVAEECDLWICPNQDHYAFRAEVNALGTIHDLMHRYEPGFPEVGNREEYESREFHFRETCRWARGILVDSTIGAEHVREAYGADPRRVFVLPYVAPAPFYSTQVDPAEGENLARRYSLPEKFFLYPAQFFAHKNHAGLILAIERMKADYPDVRLVLAGATERNGYAGAAELVREHSLENIVQFLGYVPETDMPELYRRARALVMPTFFGPTNIPQLEAFAMGCPVATSRIYGIPEQVGDAALLFDPGSESEIHDCLVRLWSDDELCRTLSRKGREHSQAWGPPQFSERLRAIVDAIT